MSKSKNIIAARTFKNKKQQQRIQIHLHGLWFIIDPPIVFVKST